MCYLRIRTLTSKTHQSIISTPLGWYVVTHFPVTNPPLLPTTKVSLSLSPQKCRRVTFLISRSWPWACGGLGETVVPTLEQIVTGFTSWVYLPKRTDGLSDKRNLFVGIFVMLLKTLFVFLSFVYFSPSRWCFICFFFCVFCVLFFLLKDTLVFLLLLRLYIVFFPFF